MKRFDILKTIQLMIMLLLTAAALFTVFRNEELYGLIASNAGVRLLSFLLWLGLGLSFIFLFIDFNSYAGIKRENAELDHAIYADALTGIANRYSVDTYLAAYLNKPLPPDMGCVTYELTSLGEINARSGNEAGDEAIQIFSDILKNAAQGVCFIC